jgi:hypothetical protein
MRAAIRDGKVLLIDTTNQNLLAIDFSFGLLSRAERTRQ